MPVRRVAQVYVSITKVNVANVHPYDVIKNVPMALHWMTTDVPVVDAMKSENARRQTTVGRLHQIVRLDVTTDAVNLGVVKNVG